MKQLKRERYRNMVKRINDLPDDKQMFVIGIINGMLLTEETKNETKMAEKAGQEVEIQVIRLKGPTSVEMMQVIKVTAEKGTGIEGDPVREIIQYWDTEGNLLAETDTDPTYLCDLVEWESARFKKIIEENSRKRPPQRN